MQTVCIFTVRMCVLFDLIFYRFILWMCILQVRSWSSQPGIHWRPQWERMLSKTRMPVYKPEDMGTVLEDWMVHLIWTFVCYLPPAFLLFFFVVVDRFRRAVFLLASYFGGCSFSWCCPAPKINDAKLRSLHEHKVRNKPPNQIHNNAHVWIMMRKMRNRWRSTRNLSDGSLFGLCLAVCALWQVINKLNASCLREKNRVDFSMWDPAATGRGGDNRNPCQDQSKIPPLDPLGRGDKGSQDTYFRLSIQKLESPCSQPALTASSQDHMLLVIG